MARVLNLVASIADAPDVPTFADRALNGLTDLVPADVAIFNEIDFATRDIRFVRPSPAIVDYVDDDVFFERSGEIPICRMGDPGDAGVLRGSDVMSRRAVRRLEVYGLMMRPFDFDIKIAFAAPRQVSRAFILSRIDCDFTDRERDLLALLLPHFDLAYRRVGMASRLSEREREILALVAAGRTNREIAEALYLSPLTVRTHLEHAFAKLGVRTRTAAVAAIAGYG